MIQNPGLSCTEFELLEEWNDMVQYAVSSLKTTNCEYRYTYIAQFQNMLLLAEAILCLPVSSAACERWFSVMKRVKTESVENIICTNRDLDRVSKKTGILRIVTGHS